MATFHQVLKEAEKKARTTGKESSACKLLLLHFSGLTSSELYLSLDQEMKEENLRLFEEALNKYITNNIPVQYLIGYVYFYGYQFLVDEGVLIPRYETEELVANVLIEYDELFQGEKVRLVDIGTGSGAIAISLALEEPNLDVSATDISLEALEVARKNSEHLNAKVTFYAGDMIEPVLGQKYDILVSNPPYIPSSELVDSIISENEPHVALFGGDDGMKFYEIILKNAHRILNPKNFLAFEHAYDKQQEMHSLARHYFPNARIYTLKDMQGKDRMTFVVNE